MAKKHLDTIESLESIYFDSIGWRLHRAWRWFLRIPKELRWKHQRMTRGWADCDAWNVNLYLARVAIGMLRRLREEGNGYPLSCKSIKEWKSELRTMEDGFQAYLDMDDVPFVYKAQYRKSMGKLEARRRKGMWLFVRRFGALWD